MRTLVVDHTPERIRPTLWKSGALALAILAIAVTVVFPRAVLELLLPDQTIYADGFSEDGFGQLRLGMTEAEVLATLGTPLRVSEYVGPRVYESNWASVPSAVVGADFLWWAYTKHGRLSDSYHVRAVKFSRDRRVVELLHRYYAD